MVEYVMDVSEEEKEVNAKTNAKNINAKGVHNNNNNNNDNSGAAENVESNATVAIVHPEVSCAEADVEGRSSPSTQQPTETETTLNTGDGDGGQTPTNGGKSFLESFIFETIELYHDDKGRKIEKDFRSFPVFPSK